MIGSPSSALTKKESVAFQTLLMIAFAHPVIMSQWTIISALIKHERGEASQHLYSPSLIQGCS